MSHHTSLISARQPFCPETVEQVHHLLNCFFSASRKEDTPAGYAAFLVLNQDRSVRGIFADLIRTVDMTDPHPFSTALQSAREVDHLDRWNSAPLAPPDPTLEALLRWAFVRCACCPVDCVHPKMKPIVPFDVRRIIPEVDWLQAYSFTVDPEPSCLVHFPPVMPHRFSPDPILDEIFCLLDGLRTIGISSGLGAAGLHREIRMLPTEALGLMRAELDRILQCCGRSAVRLCQSTRSLWKHHRRINQPIVFDPLMQTVCDWLEHLPLWSTRSLTGSCAVCGCPL